MTSNRCEPKLKKSDKVVKMFSFNHAAIHLSFIVLSVFDLRKHHVLLEILFWLLASLSCYFIGAKCSTSSMSSTSPAMSTVAARNVSPSPSVPAAVPPSTPKNRTLRIQILQARWGTTSKDMDVTEQVQQMIAHDEVRSKLTISKHFNFNKNFGDPAKFRRKYLRLVALVDGEPYINSIYELRKKDFVLCSGRGALDKEADNEAVIESTNETAESTKTAQIISATTEVVTGSTSSCVPVVSNISATYLIMSSTPFQNQTIDTICSSAEIIAEFIALFGTSFLPVRANVTDNVKKIRIKSDRILQENPTLSISTIGEFIGYERSQKEERVEGSVTLSMLWLKRALDFLDRFLKNFLDGGTTTAAARSSFMQTLAPYQGWMLRTTCKTALKMVPTREQFGTIIILPNVDKLYWNQIVNEELKMMMSSYSIVVRDIDSWFESQGLDFQEKA